MKRFVPQHVIAQRAQANDDRFARELRARYPKFLAPEILGFASIEIVPAETPVIVDDEADPFGPAPTETVQSPLGDPTAGYTKPGRWGRRQDGRPVRLGGTQGEPKGKR